MSLLHEGRGRSTPAIEVRGQDFGLERPAGILPVVVNGDTARRLMRPIGDGIRERYAKLREKEKFGGGFHPITELPLRTSDPSRGIGQLPNRPLIVFNVDGQDLLVDYLMYGRPLFEAAFGADAITTLPISQEENPETSRGIPVRLLTTRYTAMMLKHAPALGRPEERLYREDRASIAHIRVNLGVDVWVPRTYKPDPLNEDQRLEEYVKAGNKRAGILIRQS